MHQVKRISYAVVFLASYFALAISYKTARRDQSFWKYIKENIRGRERLQLRDRLLLAWLIMDAKKRYALEELCSLAPYCERCVVVPPLSGESVLPVFEAALALKNERAATKALALLEYSDTRGRSLFADAKILFAWRFLGTLEFGDDYKTRPIAKYLIYLDWYRKGQLYEQCGKVEVACDCYEKAIKAIPHALSDYVDMCERTTALKRSPRGK